VPKDLSSKMYEKWTGPYIIHEVCPNYTYKLREVENFKILHSVYNASGLKIFKERQNVELPIVPPAIQPPGPNAVQNNTQPVIPNQPSAVLPPDNANDKLANKFFDFDKILKTRKARGKREFYIRWLDGSKSWEPKENLSQRTLEEYYRTHTKTTGRRRKRPLNQHRYFNKQN
jgi:hypothetical protein